MEDRYGNRGLARWLIARHRRKKMDQRVADELDEACEQMAATTKAQIDMLAFNMLPLPVAWKPEDYFDFALCTPADEIRAHGMGVRLGI